MIDGFNASNSVWTEMNSVLSLEDVTVDFQGKDV
jgi:hypothetical protein